jgi:hypothetical protein
MWIVFVGRRSFLMKDIGCIDRQKTQRYSRIVDECGRMSRKKEWREGKGREQDTRRYMIRSETENSRVVE